jgi:hypothetical protein
MSQPASKIPLGQEDTEDGPFRRVVPGRARQPSQVMILLWPFLLYTVLVSCLGYCMREEIGPDAICHTQYLVEGRFIDSASGYWSPLFSWAIAPLIHLGVDGLYAARIVLAIWGGLAVVASYSLMRSLVRRPQWGAMLTLLLIATEMARIAGSALSPDVILAAVLLSYFALVTSRAFHRQPAAPFLAGALGAIAFFAKAHALPFFLVQYPVVIAARFFVRSGHVIPRRAVAAWLVGMVAFVVIAGPWIGLLSWKYGKCTFSTVTGPAHTLIGPPDKPRVHPWKSLAYHLPPGRMTAWETPEMLPYNHWASFESKAYFLHQANYSVRNARDIVTSVGFYDLIGISLPA